MSKFLTAGAVSEFDAEVKHVYQGMATLRQCFTVRTNVVGESYRFARMGKGMANQKATQADVVPMNIDHARQIAYLYNWNAPEYTDIFDQAEVNYEEKQELAYTIAGGLGRREDQIGLDVLNTSNPVATNDLDPNTGLLIDTNGVSNISKATLHRARRHFQELETTDETYICCEAEALQHLLNVGDPRMTSTDYNMVQALVEGDLKTKWLGFNWKIMGLRSEGGLPSVTGSHVAYAWSKRAVGFAVGIDMRTEINYIPHKTSWLTNGLYKAGAVLREPQGVVKMIYDERKDLT
jgi:hypothetical protein